MLPVNVSHNPSSAGDDMGVSNFSMKPAAMVSEGVRFVVQCLLYGILMTTICSFGIVSNIVNIICFIRQGLNDPVNVSLLGLAISDLACLVIALGSAICFNPGIELLDLPVAMFDFVFHVFAWPHFVFAGMTSWITALITLERCLCITMPVKVKSIITPNRVAFIILGIFILLTCNVSPVYCISKLSWVFSPEQNRTILGKVYITDNVGVEQFAYAVNNGVVPFSAYFTIIVCTITLVGKLRDKTKWRKTCTQGTDHTTKRDQKISQMVVMISTLFIGCFTPMCIIFMLIVAVPELGPNGPNQNFLYISGGLSLLLESANSSANIFIYYRMSSRYKSMLQSIFGCRKAGSESKTFVSRSISTQAL